MPLTANKDVYFPWWAEALAWSCVAFPCAFIPGWFYYYTCTGGLWQVSAVATPVVMVCGRSVLLLHLQQWSLAGNTHVVVIYGGSVLNL